MMTQALRWKKQARLSVCLSVREKRALKKENHRSLKISPPPVDMVYPQINM